MLRKTQLLQCFMSADVFLLAETALRGEIHEIPEYLFFERWHDKGSVLADPRSRAVLSGSIREAEAAFGRIFRGGDGS